MHLDDISGEKYALYFHNLLSENVDDLPFITFYDDFSVSLENHWNATPLMDDVGIRPIVITPVSEL